MSNCNLGKFMLFDAKKFAFRMISKAKYELNSDYDYHASFYYYKEGTDCSNTDMYLEIYLKALDIKEPIIIVNSSYTLESLPKWNKLSSCIRVGYNTSYTVKDFIL